MGPQIGAVVIAAGMNLEATIIRIKADYPKAVLGTQEVAKNGDKYIPVYKE